MHTRDFAKGALIILDKSRCKRSCEVVQLSKSEQPHSQVDSGKWPGWLNKRRTYHKKELLTLVEYLEFYGGLNLSSC